MKRTPQPTLTQSKLTSLLQAQTRNGGEAPQAPVPGVDARQTISLETLDMDTYPSPAAASVPAPGLPAAAAAPPMTAEFFQKALKDNSEHIIKSFNHSLDALSQRIDNNSTRIASNAGSITTLSAASDSQRSELCNLADRVAILERGNSLPAVHDQRATLS